MIELSIIVPTFRSDEESLQRCIKSILLNSGNNVEIILIDDGNTASYREKVYSHQVFSDERIRILFQDNKGVSTARNNGISSARGEYLAFVDSDDILLNDFTSYGLRVARENNADLVIGGIITSKGTQLDDSIRGSKAVDIFNRDTVNKIVEMSIGSHHYLCDGKAYVGRGSVARIVKTVVARKVQFDSALKIYEDTVWNLDVINHCNTVCVVDDVWYGYFRNEDSASKGFHLDEVERSTLGMRMIYNRIDSSQSCVKTAFVEQCLIEYARIMTTFFLNQENKKSFIKTCSDARSMMTSEPWNCVTWSSVFKLKGKMKLRGFLYVTRLWLPCKYIKHSFRKK